MTNIMTAQELSQYLKVSDSTIYKLAHNGSIPGFKIGDSWRFDFDEIGEFIKQSTKKTVDKKGANTKGGE